jgi:4-aminobutyrate aminotransferase-like enzyme
MTHPPLHSNEPQSQAARVAIADREPTALRTYTPTLAVLDQSAGIYHWTPEGRQLFDFTSGVLVANLGHNPRRWLIRLQELLGWDRLPQETEDFVRIPSLTTYNAVAHLEVTASRRLLDLLASRPAGARMEQVMWAASGSEAVQKALWAALARDRSRDIILATRFGFHGKKGLAGATTGCETDPERDPRVRFIRFPMEECRDLSLRGTAIDLTPYRLELEGLKREFGRRINVLITEPYLGGGGSYHPPSAYLRLLQEFCRANDVVFVLDEVQSSFGRTGQMFAFETHGLEPDVVVLGKGLANGAPGAAAVGPRSLFAALNYGEASDTYSGNPFVCAAVIATLEAYADGEILKHARRVSAVIERGLVRLKELPFVRHVRGELGESGGMVWGVETRDADVANACVLECYRGEGNRGIHLLGPLAKKVIRIAPPLVISEAEAAEALDLMHRCLRRIA